MAEYIEREASTNGELTETKIKAIAPQIIVSDKTDKPYYSILYYDIERKEWVVGYGSYNLEYVQMWLRECFKVIKADVEPVMRGEWEKGHYEDGLFDGENFDECSVCNYQRFLGKDVEFKTVYDYCPNCGAKMDGDDNA